MVEENGLILSSKENMDVKFICMLLAFIIFLFVLMEDTLSLYALGLDGGSQKQKYIICAAWKSFTW